MNLLYLASVGSFFSPDTQEVYPAEFNGVTEIADTDCGVHIEEVSSEWFQNVSLEDRTVLGLYIDVNNYFN